MLRAFARLSLVRSIGDCYTTGSISVPPVKFFSSQEVPDAPDFDRMPYLHHGQRPRFRDQPKFKSPRKRASSLMQQLKNEAIERSKKENPKVWEVPFRVGDAIEFEIVAQGGVQSDKTEKVRGVVLGIFRKGLDHSVLIRDVLFGEPIERRIPLHSPLIRSLKVLETNFVFKGKKRIKRAKLYYLRDRNPLGKFLWFHKHLIFNILSSQFLFHRCSDTSDKVVTRNTKRLWQVCYLCHNLHYDDCDEGLFPPPTTFVRPVLK